MNILAAVVFNMLKEFYHMKIKGIIEF